MAETMGMNSIQKKSCWKSLFYIFFVSLFLFAVVSILFFLAMCIFGFIPVGDLLSNLVHYFYLHYKQIPLLAMVLLILAIIVTYLFALIMSYLMLIHLYSRGSWGGEAGEISLRTFLKRKKKGQE